MNMSVAPEDVCKVLRDVRELLKDHVLPRLNQLEDEVRLLRKVTWPVCQSLRESSQLDEVDQKRAFLEDLDHDEIRMLLNEKATVSRRDLSWSSSGLTEAPQTFYRETRGSHPA